MSISSISSVNSYQANQVNWQNNLAQRQSAFQALASALQAGNLSDAQKAFAALSPIPRRVFRRKPRSKGVSKTPSPPISVRSVKRSNQAICRRHRRLLNNCSWICSQSVERVIITTTTIRRLPVHKVQHPQHLAPVSDQLLGAVEAPRMPPLAAVLMSTLEA